jgi:hypothetical protein
MSVSTPCRRFFIEQQVRPGRGLTPDPAMTLDVPPGPLANNVPGYRYQTTEDCLKATQEHLDFIKARRQSSNVEFLNVLQGNNPHEADYWYDTVKHYPFEGWAVAGLGGRCSACWCYDPSIATRRC